jgi:GNAT superfamily N-acetyltransferase
MNAKIRKADAADSAGLARVQVDSYRIAYAGIFPQSYLDHFTHEEQEQDWRDLISADFEDVLLVAESEVGEIIGYALGAKDAGKDGPYAGELVALHVRRTAQGQGIGRQLIAATARELHRAGCQSLMVWVLEENPARALYEHLGGQLIGEKEFEGNGEFGTAVKEVAYGWIDIDQLSGAET